MNKKVQEVPKTMKQLEEQLKKMNDVYQNRQQIRKEIQAANRERMEAHDDRVQESRREVERLRYEIAFIKYQERVNSFTYVNGVLDLGDTIIRMDPDATIKLRVEKQMILIDAYKPGTKAMLKHEVGTFRIYNGNSIEKDIVIRDMTMAKLRELLF